MGKHKNRFKFDSVNLVSYIWSKRRILLWVAIFAILISFIVSLLIKPKFKSTVVMFPASSASISKSLLSTSSSYSREDILKFGGQEEGEQLMQILLSSQIRERIVQKFQLAKHYNIDTTSRYWRSKLTNEYNDNITFHRTEYMSVVIDVLDHNPEMAALIANEISNQIDSVMNRVQHERAMQAFHVVEKEYSDLQSQLSKIQDSIKSISELNVIGFDKAANAYHAAYAKSLSQGKTQGIKVLENKLRIVAKYEGTYLMLTRLLQQETERMSAMNEKYMEAKVDAEQFIPHKFIIDKAYKSDKKDSPKRMLIVLFSTLSALFFALLIVVIQDSINFKKD